MGNWPYASYARKQSISHEYSEHFHYIRHKTTINDQICFYEWLIAGGHIVSTDISQFLYRDILISVFP